MMTTKTLTRAAAAAIMLILLPFGPLAAQDAKPSSAAQEAPVLKDEKEKSSYAVGMNVGTALRMQSADLDLDAVFRGLKDAYGGSKTLLTDAEMKAVLTRLQNELKAKQATRRSEVAARTKAEGEAFLAANKNKEGVVTLESGLQYKVLRAGTGKTPTIKDTVVCEYRGTLIDGTEFDSSRKRATPATFALSRVIKGWAEALQLMPVGSKWQLFIPPPLAYGERSQGRNVPPNATLIFEVDLLSIEDATPSPAGDDGLVVVPSTLAAINVSFKIDPRITKGTWLGERWVSPPFTQVGADAKHVIVQARAEGLDGRGRPVAIRSEWVAGDGEMVTIIPEQGNQVSITARRPGETVLWVTANGISTQLGLKAEQKGDVLHVAVSKK